MKTQTDDVAGFLLALPDLQEPENSVSFVLDGFLLRGEVGTVRMIVGSMCLDFSSDDIIDIAEVDAIVPDDSFVTPVRATLLRGARVVNAVPAVTYAELFGKPLEPFAYGTRRDPPNNFDSPRFRAMEEAFRQKHDLE